MRPRHLISVTACYPTAHSHDLVVPGYLGSTPLEIKTIAALEITILHTDKTIQVILEVTTKTCTSDCLGLAQ